MRITWAPFGAFLQLAGALSWAHTSFWKGDTAQGVKELAGSPSPEEIVSILKGSDALEKYSAKPDCFRRAAAMVRASCAQLETREDERVKAALAMTLCEIATAEHHSFPMECTPFQSDFQASYRDGHASPSRCVQALSRSAQYWSSYSGYLREVPQLCFAFRRWNDIGTEDMAKELHRNTTEQSLTLLQYLTGREKLSEHILLQSEALVKDMRVVLDELHSSSASINALPSAIVEELRQVLSKISNDYQSSTVVMQQHLLQEHTLERHKMEVRLDSVVADLTMATSTLGPMLERLLSDSIEAALASITLTMQSLHEMAATSHFGDLERDVVLLQHDIRTLTGDVHTVKTALEEGLRTSLMAQEKQLETAKAAEGITAALHGLIDKAHLEVQRINDTAIAVKRSLLNDSGPAAWSGVTWSWFEAASLFILKYIWKDHAYLDVPAFRILALCWRVLWSFLGFASSGLLSALVLLLSRNRLLLSNATRAELHSDGGVLHAYSDDCSARLRYLGSTATAGSSVPVCDTPGSLDTLDTTPRSTSKTTRRHRSHFSRIPERLCRPSDC